MSSNPHNQQNSNSKIKRMLSRENSFKVEMDKVLPKTKDLNLIEEKFRLYKMSLRVFSRAYMMMQNINLESDE